MKKTNNTEKTKPPITERRFEKRSYHKKKGIAPFWWGWKTIQTT